RFNSLGLNLTKIESRPRKGKEFEYLFYLDFSGNVHSANVIELISQLGEEMPEFSFLGNYSESCI
ncbi:MAG: bifunctional chorismate mutase/prephenate dehydratase, partial [Ruminococcus bromii]|nr:bifunctional chorismate mutase/prephenate dehydratase [Ruminococcus bromii]